MGRRDSGISAWSGNRIFAMTQYVLMLSSRMVAIASACLALLGILLFLLGVEIGKLWVVSYSNEQKTITNNYSNSIELAERSKTANDTDLLQNKAP